MSHLPRADFPAAARPNLADSSPWRVRFRAIYEDLRKKIILLDFPPGTRLDVEALAREHDVSRTPIRTVIQRLESEGLAITRHGVGTVGRRGATGQHFDTLHQRGRDLVDPRGRA